MSTGTEHSDVPHNLPLFITGPGQTDILFIFVIVLVLLILLIAGNFYFKLHALPEHMAHGRRSTQFQLVGVLALLALFTHQNLYWVAALVIATVRFPDFLTPLESIAASLKAQTPAGQSQTTEQAGAKSDRALKETNSEDTAAGPIPPNGEPEPGKQEG